MDKMEGLKEPVEIRIKLVQNGVTVCAYVCDEKTEHEYVYKDIKSAVKEIESIFSVLREEAPKETRSDLDKEEEKINKGEY